jgi:flagellum-specific peptidoglycan hydrolase FlgJ
LRWRRPILHASACAAVLVSVGLGVTSQPRGTGQVEEPQQLALPLTAATPVAPRLAEPQKPVIVLAAPTIAPAEPRPLIGEVALAPDEESVGFETRSYTVEPGDSVRTIAAQFGVTNETIIWENDLSDPDYIEVGRELQILPFSGLIHEVRPGDTIASVANGYEALIEDVVKVNRLAEPFVIVVGQKLAVPGGYRPLPRKVVVEAPRPGGDTVQAPPDTDQHAATVKAPAPPPRKLPVLGNTPQEQFIASIGEAAIVSHERTGVPASVTISQAILESFWGSSRLAREGNNYFGIKAQTRTGSAGVIWFDVWEVIGGRNVMQRQPFRAYNSIADSFVDHGRFFLENGRYAAAMAARGDAKQFAREIARGGYATDPAYASKLIALMDRYNLYRFDE